MGMFKSHPAISPKSLITRSFQTRGDSSIKYKVRPRRHFRPANSPPVAIAWASCTARKLLPSLALPTNSTIPGLGTIRGTIQ